MLVYRIVHKLYSKKIIAPGFAGRWNGSGRKVVYCAESIALAFLENMIRRQGIGFNQDFKTMILEIPESLKIQSVLFKDLPNGWRKFNDYSKSQPIGNSWYDEGIFPILKVPSAVLPESYNYVLNATHPDCRKIKLLKTTDLIPDERIEDLLKKRR
ncbi:MAG TPA: RES family NAD+ phosphorylase [Puia sp.]|jgi:RES domain-containing protein